MKLNLFYHWMLQRYALSSPLLLHCLSWRADSLTSWLHSFKSCLLNRPVNWIINSSLDYSLLVSLYKVNVGLVRWQCFRKGLKKFKAWSLLFSKHILRMFTVAILLNGLLTIGEASKSSNSMYWKHSKELIKLLIFYCYLWRCRLMISSSL